jgi:hypothetical protein
MTSPYFYIIQHVSSKKYYVGVRWAIGCNPAELLTENGYHTSSEIVKDIIRVEGVSAFAIRKIKQFTSAEDTRLYETLFLKRVNAVKNDMFFNLHNNEKISFGTPEYAAAMRKAHGVEHSMHNPASRERMEETTKRRYGGLGFQNSYAKQAAVTALIKKYGSVSAAGKVARAHAKQAIKEKYNVDNPSQHPDILAKIKSAFKRIGHAQGSKNSQYGTIWITNNVENKKIRPDELHIYTADGWRKGRVQSNVKLKKAGI